MSKPRLREHLPAEAPQAERSLWAESRDVFTFQLKLIMEGLRDVLMGPFTLLAWLGDLVRGERGPNRWFYRVLRMGHRYDRWLDLYGALDRKDGQPHQGVDIYLDQVEQLLRKQEAKHGVIRRTRGELERTLERIRKSPSDT